MAKKESKETKTKAVKEEKIVKEKKEETKVKKETKKTPKNKKETNKVPKESYFEGVRNEMSKVKWPSKKEVMKYTMATIIFVIVLVAFFILMSLLMSVIKGAFN